MSRLKYKRYTLWLKWRNFGWAREITAVVLPFPAKSPIEILLDWIEYKSWPWLTRGLTWMILPEPKTPKGYDGK